MLLPKWIENEWRIQTTRRSAVAYHIFCTDDFYIGNRRSCGGCRCSSTYIRYGLLKTSMTSVCHIVLVLVVVLLVDMTVVVVTVVGLVTWMPVVVIWIIRISTEIAFKARYMWFDFTKVLTVVVDGGLVVMVRVVGGLVVEPVVLERPEFQMLNRQKVGSVIGADSGPGRKRNQSMQKRSSKLREVLTTELHSTSHT